MMPPHKFIPTILFLFTACLLQAEAVLQNPWLKVEVKNDLIQFSARSASYPMRATLPLKGKAKVRDQKIVIRDTSTTTTIVLSESAPFAFINTQLHNHGTDSITLRKLDIPELTLDIEAPGNTLCTLGTGGRKPHDQPEGSYTYHALADALSRNGILCGWLTQQRGVGLFVPEHRDGKNLLQPQLDFGQMTLKPGTTRNTDTLLIGFFEDIRHGLEQYADTIAETLDIQLPPKPNVYCTWYHRNLSGSGASTEQMLKENAEFAKKHLKPFGLDVLQIDDHWQALEPAEKQNKGPIKTFVNTSEYFPSGMAHTAQVIRDYGFTPGIWYMPFAGDLHNPYFDRAVFATDNKTGEPFEDNRWSGTTIDASSPAGETFLRNRFKRIHEWGYQYIKVDGLHIGAPSHNIYVNRAYEGKTFANASIHDPDLTFIEAYRKGLQILRDENPDTFILGCSATQNMISFGPVFGMVDAMRVGPDNDRAMNGEWEYLLRGPDFAGNLWFLNNRVWYNDPDPIYIRSSNPLHKARWMASWLAVSGAMNTTSMQYEELAPERFDLLKRTLPAHNLDVLPVDILEHQYPQIWKVANDRITVLCLLNWDETEDLKINYPFERIGLYANDTYQVFDYWEDSYLGTMSTTLISTLAGANCQVLAIRKAAPHPQLLSTSRHITQGLMDVKSETWNAKARTLQGTSHVVEKDPYEMRITCPPEYKLEDIRLSGVKAKVNKSTNEEGLIRITITPKASGIIEWSIQFKSQSS